MRTYGYLLVCLLCSVPRVAAAQLTARDTAMLVDAIAERIHIHFGTGPAREPFVIVGRTPFASFAARVSAAVRARDSSLIVAEPTQLTRRLQVGALDLITGDTATLKLHVARCEASPLRNGWSDESLAFRRAGDRWTYAERNVGGSGGASSGCPW